ncbi:MAG TPA: HAMP domain-containing sensor histidine kinase, partial [Fimbriimonas sp.]
FLARVLSKLRESREQQKELTGFIVHDLRSPISSAITGLITLEQTGHLGELEQEMVTLALVSNQRALSLVNSMLDVAKLESGKMELRTEAVALDRFVDDAFDQVALWARSHEIGLVKEVHVATAMLDPALTMRILVNLLSNALKFSPPGSNVVVHVDPSPKDGIRFAVQDHGPGIPPEYAERIFEPFSQVKGTQGGTGLGLTFCRLAVHAQGGRIWVDSHLGKGTSMIFTLPHAQTLPSESAKPALEKV